MDKVTAVRGLLVLSISSALLAAPLSADARQRFLYRDGQRLTFTVDGQGPVRIAARSSRCKGSPVLKVWVDGQRDTTIRPNAERATWRSGATVHRAGRHRVTVVMRGDKWVRKNGRIVCNRKIRVVGVRMTRPNPVTPAPPVIPTPVPGDSDGAFTFGVIGDTQAEVFGPNTAANSFQARTAWLAAHRTEQDLRFVAHTGDITNWGWLAPAQFDIAVSAMQNLGSAGLPFQISVGNHDTAAVGHDGVAGSRNYGGSAYVNNPECVERLGVDACRTPLLVRDTEAFNSRFSAADLGAVAGQFEAGRLDNAFSTFEAAGRSWLVLNLELWPRQEALTWASQVVADHPDHNVIVQTHSYLSGGTGISGGRDYGSLSPQEICRQLVKPHENVKIVLSGHAGRTATRIDTGSSAAGCTGPSAAPGGPHQVVSFLGNETGGRAVVRLIDINVRTGVVASRYWSGSADLSAAPIGTTYTRGFVFR